MEGPFFIGVDVGSGSARAALVDKHGHIINKAAKEIHIWSPKPKFFQQSSEEIWKACCYSVKEVTKNLDKKLVRGIGFDATCSLAVVDKNGFPVSVSLDGEEDQNVIMWMDHRAEEEAKFINSSNHPILENVGGKISLEMQMPKLLWLKKNLQQCWEKADLFFDLPDFLTWKATGSDSRSLCSVVCKWMYEAFPSGEGCWNKEFLNKINLTDLIENNFHKIGNTINAPGQPCGKGLSQIAAAELNLLPGTPVGTSIIDAHAGGVGLVGCKADNISPLVTSRLALICGTSTCHMAVSEHRLPIRGVWGPYYSAMIPGLWLNEAGQSATGKLIDHIIDIHPASAEIKKSLPPKTRIIDYLNSYVRKMALEKSTTFDLLTQDLHVWPDFHGNRSPVADSSLKGMISGLDLNAGEENLALLYLSTIQALGYGTRHIMEVMEKQGYEFDSILVCGGLSKNELFLQCQANIVSKTVLIPTEVECVLTGAAILGATASGFYKNVVDAIENMACKAEVVKPCELISRYHDKKYEVFKKMLEHQQLYQKIMCS